MANIEDLIALREVELAKSGTDRAWGELVEKVLAAPRDPTEAGPAHKRLAVNSATRWG